MFLPANARSFWQNCAKHFNTMNFSKQCLYLSGLKKMFVTGHKHASVWKAKCCAALCQSTECEIDERRWLTSQAQGDQLENDDLFSNDRL